LLAISLDVEVKKNAYPSPTTTHLIACIAALLFWCKKANSTAAFKRKIKASEVEK
jgi:hypothetical protein